MTIRDKMLTKRIEKSYRNKFIGRRFYTHGWAWRKMRGYNE